MAQIGTFGSFGQARLAIYASQAGLQVTGNNIANINTKGYTRQKLDQSSFYSGGSDRYYSKYDVRIGNGVFTDGVSQLRDPYLDIRYREQTANVGYMDTMLGELENVQRVLDEVGDGDEAFGVLEAQFSTIYSALMELTDQTGHMEYDTQVRAACESLVSQFNSYAAQLNDVYKNAVHAFEQDVKAVNNILTNIRDLNTSIRKAEIHGDKALELRDERNLLIDELAQYMDINVVYTEEDIGAGQTVEKLTISLGNANPDPSVFSDETVLVDGVYGRQFVVPEKVPERNPKYDPNDQNNNLPYLEPNGNPTDDKTAANQVDNTNFDMSLTALTSINDKVMIESVDTTQNPPVPIYSEPVDLDDNDMLGAFQAMREMLTESGEFATQDTVDNVDENARSKRGIPYYQQSLDLLARKFAEAMNEANKPKTTVTATDTLYNNGVINAAASEDINGMLFETTTANGVETFNLSAGCDLLNDTFSYTDTVTGRTETANLNTADIAQEYPNMSQEDQEKMRAIQLEHLLSLGHGTLLAKQDPDTGDYMTVETATEGGNLFSNNGDTDDDADITASNISIAHSWSVGNVRIVATRYNDPAHENYNPLLDDVALSTQSDNILHMAGLFFEKTDYHPSDLDPNLNTERMFNGTFQEMWQNIGTTLGHDMDHATTMLDNSYNNALELDTARDSVSAVDLNDEAMNLMQYSQSYNAACRLMTTIDSVLDKLINGTAI